MTPAESTLCALEAGRAAADRKEILPFKERELRLRRLAETLHYRQDAACAALEDDFARSREESLRWELRPLLSHLSFLRKKFRSWSASHDLFFGKPYWLGGKRKQCVPCGQVLIAARWEYPLLDTLPAVASAFAAGNRVVLKLSRRTPQSMEFLRWLLENIFSREEITVVGDELPLGALLTERFDRIWFSGSDSEVQGVLALAEEHHTPVILAPGGRNPCVIGENADPRHAARCIVRSKFLNAGQSCSAVDCLYVHRSVRDLFVRELAAAIRRRFGSRPLEDRTILPLVDVAAYGMICANIGRGRLLAGGSRDPQRSAVEPSVIDRLAPDDPLFTADLHGPVLALAVFSDPAELAAQLEALPSVNVLYGFGLRRRMRRKLADTVKPRCVFWDQAPCLALVPGRSGLHRRIAKELFSGFLDRQILSGLSPLQRLFSSRS